MRNSDQHRVARSARVFIVAFFYAVTSQAYQQAVQELVGPTETITEESYKTWSLFLVCNPDWVAPEKSADLANLYRRFRAFGDAIGHDNLAVWFWKERRAISDPRLTDNVDVARSAEFCRTLGLAPSRGPYLVVTSAYPDVHAFPEERAVFELGGSQPADIAQLLNRLTDQLLLQGELDSTEVAAVETSTGDEVAKSGGRPGASLWIRLLEGTRQSLLGLGCALKLKIDTGLLSAELRACEV